MLRQIKKIDWGLLLAVVLPLIAALPTWGDGIAAGADVEVHVHRIHAITLSLMEGNLYPRWITYFHMGYGYPIFNFYAPGSAYITALFELVGLHITTAYNLVQTAAWVIGSAGMYWLARRALPMPAAVLAAALWTLAPSRLYEVWWQGSLAQIVAASFIPYVLLGVLKNSEQPSLRRILTIALPYALLIMTHTPMMYISTIYAAPLALLAPFFFVKFDGKALLMRWGTIGAGFALGIGLAAIFLLPTLLELQYVEISQGLDETVNFLREQYLPPTEIFAFPALIDRTNLYLEFPRTLGFVGGVLSILGIGGLIWRRRYGLLIASLSGLAFTVFMLLAISFDVWLLIPQFENLRFPARLLRIGAVFIALLGGASLLVLPERWRRGGMLVGIVLATVQILPISQPYDVWLNWQNISAYDELLHEQQDRTWGTVSYDEFNPIWGERIFLDAPTNAVRYVDEPFHLRVFGRDIAAANWQGFSEENITDNILRVETDEDRAVRFRQYYFPGWQARVNGQPTDIYPDEQVGLITIDLPAGEHIVELEYVGTGTQLIATVITWFSVVICLGLVYFGRNEQIQTAELSDEDEPLPSGFSTLVIVGIVAVAILNDAVIQANGWLAFNSPPTEPRSMASRVDASFGEQVTLLGYTLHDTVISDDDLLGIDLYWHVPEAIADNYRPVVQLVTLSQDGAMATNSNLQPAAGEFSTYTPDFYAQDPYDLRLFETGVAPYVGQIMVQLLGEDGALMLEDGSDRLILEPIITVQAAEDEVPVAADDVYRVGDVAELQCASITETGDTIFITLGWRLLAPSTDDLVVMVQGLDADSNLVASGDAPPFNGNYPALYWRSGQSLFDRHELFADEAITAIATGLYRRDDVMRLPITQNDEAIANNQIILDIEADSCAR